MRDRRGWSGLILTTFAANAGWEYINVETASLALVLAPKEELVIMVNELTPVSIGA